MRDKMLLPDRHPQRDLFLCDLGDVPLKDDTASMAHPIFALSTKPDLKTRVYEHGGNRVEIMPSAIGHATINDKDILIFAISQIMEAKNHGHPYSKDISFSAHDFLKFSNRMTNGQAYEGLRAAMKRLRGTTITTDIITGGIEQTDTFGLIDSARIRRTLKDGTVTDWGITLSDWLFNAIEANEVLTLHRDYFRLRKPLEKRIYEIVRKHCGNKASWRIGVDTLLKKTGSQTSRRKFKQLLRPIVEADHLPDYSAYFEDEAQNTMVFESRGTVPKRTTKVSGRIVLWPETYEKARNAAPGWDIYYLEGKWRHWQSDKTAPKEANAAFIGFCKKYYQKNGRPS